MDLAGTSALQELAELYDPFRDPILDDPYPFFARARAATPAFFSPRLNYWVITRYADVRSVLRDTKSFSAANVLDTIKPLCPHARNVMVTSGVRPPPALTNNDPPSHTRIRRVANEAFTRDRIAQMEPYIRQLVRAALDRAFTEGQADIIAGLAWELPAQVILKVIGLSESEVSRVKLAAKNRLLFNWGEPSDEQQTQLAKETIALWHFIKEFIASRVAHPKDDFTSDLLRAKENGTPIVSEDEVGSILLALLVAGHETTTSLIGNAVHWLLTDCAAWQDICADNSLIANAVEEVLRIEPSIITWRRRALEDVRFGDIIVPAGANVLLLIGAANRDPEMFPNPDRFDIRRANARQHLAFGFGAHLCLGAPLARLECSIALEELCGRFPRLKLRPGQRMDPLPTTSFRGPNKLLVEW